MQSCVFFKRKDEEIFGCVLPAVRMIRSPCARWLHWQPCDVIKNANPVDKSITALQFLCARCNKRVAHFNPCIAFWLGAVTASRWCDDVFDSQISLLLGCGPRHIILLLCDSACIPEHSQSDFIYIRLANISFTWQLNCEISFSA